MKEEKKLNKKQAIRGKGIVVNANTDKTIVVEVKSFKTYSKYIKKFCFTKRYKVDDPENKYRKGDAVKFIDSRPTSRDKKFKVITD